MIHEVKHGPQRPHDIALKFGINTWDNQMNKAGAILLAETKDQLKTMTDIYLSDFPYSHYMTEIKPKDALEGMYRAEITRRSSCD